MELESARDLKSSLMEQILASEQDVEFGRRSRLTTRSGALRDVVANLASVAVPSCSSATWDTVLTPAPVRRRTTQRSLGPFIPALGVARLGSDWGLAVRVQRVTEGTPALVERLVEAAKGEADVRTVGRLTAHAASPWRLRPLEPGLSIGHPRVDAGTLGCFVQRPGRRLEVLSANHVLANSNSATEGDPIVQPGPADGGTAPNDVVGRLSAVVPLVPGASNLMDVALCELEAGFEPELDSFAPKTLVPDPALVVDVAKIGRGSGRTEGTLEAVDVMDAYFDVPQLGSIRFDNLIEIRGKGGPFTQPGDSGAVVVGCGDESHFGVGLVIGGNRSRRLSYATPLPVVLDQLGAMLA
jgi:hypothetical protein